VTIADNPPTGATGSLWWESDVGKLRIYYSNVWVDANPAGPINNQVTLASGLVNAGVDVVLGNLKVRMAASGNRSLQISTVSGTYSVYGSGVYSQSGVSGSTIDAGAQRSVTTTPTYISPGYNFTQGGATDSWMIMDPTVGIAWRIGLIVGAGYNNNLITIERLL
jgi:hypothetical protein